MGDWSQYIIFLALAVFLVWSYTRRRKMGTPKVDTAIAILTNVNDNFQVMENRLSNWQSKKKFQTGAWKYYKGKVEFLDSSLITSLNESFVLAEDFNSRIDSARKNKVMATLQDMPVEKMREPLNKSKEGLVAWLRANLQTEIQSKKRRNFLGF